MTRVRLTLLLLLALLLLSACDSSTTQPNPDGDSTDSPDSADTDADAEADLDVVVEATEDAQSYCESTPICYGFDDTCPEMIAFWNAAAEAARCTDVSECEDSGLGCGCTCSLVINKNNDQSAMLAAQEALRDSPCDLGCACDCPPAAGFTCENGLCAWNYDERAYCVCDIESECCDGCYGRRDIGPCMLSDKAQDHSWNCCDKPTGSCQADCSHLMLFHDGPYNNAYMGENHLLGFSGSGESVLAFWVDGNASPTHLDQFSVANGYPQSWLSFTINATSGSLSDDRTLVALAASDGNVRVFSVAGSQRVFSKKTPYNPAALAFNPTNDLLAIGSVDVTVYRLSDGEQVASFPVEGESFMDVTFSPDGSLLVATSQLVKQNGVFGVFMVWNTADWSQAHQEIVGTDYINQARFSPDGLHLATIGRDGAIIVWQVSDWSQKISFDLGSSGRALAFSADGRYLAAAGERTDIWIWELASGEKRLSLSRLTGQAKRLIFSPDGGVLASQDHYDQVVLWDTRELIEQ
jgi:WD40 repeat protein